MARLSILFNTFRIIQANAKYYRIIKQGLKPILDTNFEYRLKPLKTKIQIETGKNKYR